MKLADVVGVVNQNQQIPAEIVKNLRQNFKPAEQRVHQESKVQIRTERHYKPDKDDNHWKNKYHRHVRQRNCGFYTPANIPYQTVGKVGLDLKELVNESLEHLNKREPEQLTVLEKTTDKEKKSKRKETIRFEDGLQEKISLKKAPISKRVKERETSPTPRCDGGLEEIRNNLRLHRQRKAAVRAGKPYFECIRDEAAAKAIKLMKAKTEHREPFISNTRLRQILSKMRVRERSDSQVEGDETMDGLSREDSHANIIDQREVHERNTRTLTSKLRCLYNLLCYIYNLRTKDLRTKNPLSRDFLKTLRVNVPVDHRGHIIRNTRQQTSNPPSRSRATDHNSSVNTIECRMEPQSFPMGSPHTLPRPSYFQESGSQIFRSVAGGDSSSGSANIFQRKFGPRAKEGSQRLIEMTWDELIEGRSPTQPSAPDPSSRQAAGRSSFMHAVRNVFRTSRRTGPIHNFPQSTPTAQPAEQLTLWQQVASNEKHAKEAKSSGGHAARKVHRKKRRFSKMDDIIGQDYRQIRQKTAKDVVEKLQQFSEQERTIFTQRLKAIQPSKIYELNIKAVRQAGMEVHKDYESDHVRPAKWFEELKEEAENLGVQDEAVVIQHLDNLHRFAIDDIQNVAYVKAKLCLIIQSILMYDLCSLEMQEALHVMTKALDISQLTLTDWLGQRKILPLPIA